MTGVKKPRKPLDGSAALADLIARNIEREEEKERAIPASARGAAQKARDLAEHLCGIADILDDPDTSEQKRDKLTRLVGAVARSYHGVEQRQGEWFLLFSIIQKAAEITNEKRTARPHHPHPRRPPDPWRIAVNVLRANIKTVFPGLWEKLDAELIRTILGTWPRRKGRPEGARTHGVPVDTKLEALRQALSTLHEDPVYGHLCVEGSYLVQLHKRWRKHLRVLD